ncbi:MAG: DUF4214 domain-containing protein [Reyranellaceae bacterium]
MSTPLSIFAVAVGNLLKLSNGGYTAYTYETIGNGPNDQPLADLTASTPTLYTDCSGWVNYALNTVAPIHQAVEAAARLIPFFNPGMVNADGTMVNVMESLQPWARADVLSYFFDNLATGTNGFTEVANFATLQAGDIIAYATGIYTDPINPNSGTNPTLIATKDTGHTMVVIGAPVAVPQADWGTTAVNGLAANVAQVYAVPVVDSSNLNHFVNITTPVPFTEPQADSRNYAPIVANPPNLPASIPQSSLQVGGLGFGTMWFATDANGDPLQFRFDLADPWFPNNLASVQNGNSAVSIAAGRLTSTIELSGSMLNADNQLVLTAFENAAQTLNGVAYNTQAETLTGTGGLLVEGGGLLQLGAGNSFTGGVSIANATVSLAGADAAGGGIVTFVDDFDSILQLQNAAAVPASTLLGFSAGDSIDLGFDPFTALDHAVWIQAGGAGGTLAIVSGAGTPIAKLSLNGLYSSSQFVVSADHTGNSVVTTTATSPVTVHDDAYIVLQGQALSLAAATGVLANDDNVSSAALVTSTTHGTLQLSANGGFSYTPTAGFTGVDTFSYDGNTNGSADAQALIYVIPVSTGATTTLNLLALNAQQLVAANYDAFFGRAPDAAGFNFWVNQFNTGQGGVATVLANIASSFAVSSEAQALYPFLANPQGATPAQIGAFIDSVYENLFNRLSDSAGVTYWTTQIQQTLASGGFIGSVLVNIMAGAQNSSAGQDITTLTSRIAVGLEYVHDQTLYGSPWSAANDAADATALLQAVTSSPQSVLVGIAQAQNLVLGDLS